jgi:hypothetical protein
VSTKNIVANATFLARKDEKSFKVTRLRSPLPFDPQQLTGVRAPVFVMANAPEMLLQLRKGCRLLFSGLLR